jgi:hypothetical protein
VLVAAALGLLGVGEVEEAMGLLRDALRRIDHVATGCRAPDRVPGKQEKGK